MGEELRPRRDRLHHGLVLLASSLALWWCLGFLARPLVETGDLLGGGLGHLLAGGVLCAVAAGAFFHRLHRWLDGRWQGRTWIELRLLVYCLALHAVVYLAFFHPFDRDSFSASSAVAAGLFSALLVLHLEAGRLAGSTRTCRLLGALDLAVFYLCMLLVGGELTLRLAAALKPSVLLSRSADDAAAKIAATSLPPGHLRRGFPVNTQGFYDVDVEPPPRRRPLVLAIGDSFSMGVVPHHYHFTTVAERSLPGVELYNMGVAAIGPPEYLHLLQDQGLELGPDAIVVNLFLGNDLDFALPPEDEIFLRSWYSRDNVLLYQLGRRLARLRQAGPGGPAESIAAPPALLSDQSAEMSYRWIADPSLERPTFSPGVFRRIETRRAEQLATTPDAVLLRRFEVLRQIADAAGDIPLLFMLIPDEFQVEDEVWQDIHSTSRPLPRNRAHDLLIDWLGRQGLRYLDLLPVLRSQLPLEDGRLHLYHLRDTHFNARGNRVAGEALAKAVAPLLHATPRDHSVQILPVHGDRSEPWISDLHVFNPTASSATATLKLTLVEGEPVELPALLRPHELLVIDDLVRRSRRTGAGFVSVRSESPVIAGLRTYQRRSEGTFGDIVPALPLRTDRLFLTGPGRAARVDLAVVQPAGGGLSTDLPELASLEAATARVRLELPAGSSGSLLGATPLVALMTTTDLESGDLATYPGLPARTEGVLAGFAHAADGTVSSDLSVYAPEGAELSLDFRAYGASPPHVAPLEFTLAPGKTLFLSDLLTHFGRRDTSGAVTFRASRPVLATAHTSRTGGGAPCGQALLAAPTVLPGSEAYLLFASRSGTPQSGSRSDLALVNPESFELKVHIRLASAPAVKPKTLVLAADSAVRLEDVVGWLGRERLADGVLAVRGDGPFAATLALQDPRSGDVTTSHAVIRQP